MVCQFAAFPVRRFLKSDRGTDWQTGQPFDKLPLTALRACRTRKLTG